MKKQARNNCLKAYKIKQEKNKVDQEEETDNYHLLMKT